MGLGVERRPRKSVFADCATDYVLLR
jgi:hypothetical protein